MILVLKQHCSVAEKENIITELQKKGITVTISESQGYPILIINEDSEEIETFVSSWSCVEKSLFFKKSEFKVLEKNSLGGDIVSAGSAQFGNGHFSVIAGPCSVETEEQIFETALAVKKAGAAVLRGGAFKPRTSPYAFQGLGYDGLKLLSEAGKSVGLPVISEIVTQEQLDKMYPFVDIFQVGARNMYNYELLKALAEVDKPVLLKRSMAATIDEWLSSTEYLMTKGKRDIILCERGVRTFETLTRNTLDLGAIPVMKQRTDLPIIVDPSHAIGIRSKVPPLAMAALAAGADGLMIEVHVKPEKALSDGAQSLKPNQFDSLMHRLYHFGLHEGKIFHLTKQIESRGIAVRIDGPKKLWREVNSYFQDLYSFADDINLHHGQDRFFFSINFIEVNTVINNKLNSIDADEDINISIIQF